MSLRRSQLLRGALVLALALPTLARPAVAQSGLVGGTPLATRTALEAQADSARLRARTATSDAQRSQYVLEERLLRQRLTEGDFAAGDVVIIDIRSVQGEPVLADTFAVQAGRVVTLPDQYGNVELTGVLRTELTDKVRQQAARYLRDPQVRTSTLMRVAVLGAVYRPGYHVMPADVPLSEALMRAGGPAPVADLKKVEIRRNDATLWAPNEARIALESGLTLDNLGVRGGDEILIGERRGKWTLMQTLGVISSLAAAASIFITLTR